MPAHIDEYYRIRRLQRLARMLILLYAGILGGVGVTLSAYGIPPFSTMGLLILGAVALAITLFGWWLRRRPQRLYLNDRLGDGVRLWDGTHGVIVGFVHADGRTAQSLKDNDYTQEWSYLVRDEDAKLRRYPIRTGNEEQRNEER